MRAWVAVIAFLGLLGGLYLGVRPYLFRPPLRIALELRAGNADDAAIAAGVERALEERDHRGGRWRVTAANQIRHPNGLIDFPTPRAHTILHGLRAPNCIPGPEGPLFRVSSEWAKKVIGPWMRGRGLERLGQQDLSSNRGQIRLLPEGGKWADLLRERPDVVLLDTDFGLGAEGLQSLREAGFQGPVFVEFEWEWWFRDWTPSLTEGTFYVLLACEAVPAESPLRHPFAHSAYKETLLFLDRLDGEPDSDPVHQAYDIDGNGELNLGFEEPRVYEVRDGKLVPSK
jgi:hypothetical protein